MRMWTTFICTVTIVAAYPAGRAPAAQAGGATVFEGARLIVGDGSAPIEDSAFVVQGDTITAAGPRGKVKVPAGARRVSLAGKTVMPSLIDAHTHLGFTNVKTMTTSAATYTRENLLDHLERYAYYGIAATLSLGADAGDVAFQLRRDAPAGA